MASATYNALGQPRTVNFGNGVSQRRYYGGLDTTLYVQWGKMRQLCVIQTSLGECADDAAPGRGGTGTMLFNAVYGYDASGNVTVVDDRTPGASQVNEYVYDPLDRLTEWRKVTSWSPYSATLQEAYTYSQIGNMTSKAGVTITAPATARYGFEAYTVYSTAGPCYCFAYAPNTGAWVFSGAAGVSENGTCLTSGNPPTPQMTRTAFLQTAGRMAITVTGLTVSETYRIGFVMARRGNYNAHLGRTFTVSMGGQNLGMYSPLTTTWEQALTAAVVANATSLQLVLEAGAEPGNDSMALIDDVAVTPAHPHAARAMGNGNSFEYDANGNMTVRREKLDGIAYVYTQTWTVDNRLASVIKSDMTGTILATTTISYDGDGVRVKKSDPSGATYYLGAVEVLITGTTQMTTSYYAFGGAMVAMRTAATATLTYLHGDHLGSTSLTTNAAGQKVSEQRYKPYGEVRWSSGAGMPTDFTFTGQRAGSYGTIFMSAREYLPSLGRFLSADSIVPGAGNPQALNRYAYVFNSPLGFVDPSGHGPICPNCQFFPFANFSFADFVAGFSLQYADNLALGIPSGAVEQVNDALTTNSSEAFQSGRQAADVIGFLQGAVEFAGGLAGAVTLSGGEVACVAGTAGLCLAAAPAVVIVDAAALATAAHGGAMMASIGKSNSTEKGWDRIETHSRKLGNIKKDLDVPTLEDAVRNANGEYLTWKDSGKRIDHLQKVTTGQQGLRNLIGQAKGALTYRGLTDAQRLVWKDLLSEAEEFLKFTQGYVGQ